MLESHSLMQSNTNQGILMCCNTKQHEEMLSQQDLRLPAREKKETTHSCTSDTASRNANRQKISLNERRRSMGDAEKQPSIKHRLSNFHPQATICTATHQNKENAEHVDAAMASKKTSLKHKKRSSNQPFLASILQEELEARLPALNIETDPLSATLSHILASSTFGGRAPALSPTIRLGQGLPTVRSQFATTQPRSHTNISS